MKRTNINIIVFRSVVKSIIVAAKIFHNYTNQINLKNYKEEICARDTRLVPKLSK